MVMPSFKMNLYDLTQDDLAQLLAQWGEPAYRARQVWSWLYEQRVDRFSAMLNLPASLRDRLDAETQLGELELSLEQRSTRDGTIKRLYQLRDGQLIESVLMPYDDDRRTACISTQAGCAMGCVFCATGQMGFARNLTSTEIFEQAVLFARELEAQGDRLSNVVLMGMGEPFHNYEPSMQAVRRLMSDLGIGARHITISTVGLVPQILRFADEGLQVTLAVSLHKTTDAERTPLMPVNQRWPIAELLKACETYIEKTGRRITFEWAAIAGQNDTVEEAHRLGQLLKQLNCHVNIIPLNPTGGFTGEPAHLSAIQNFIRILQSYGVSATVRIRRGIDIDAGCGQLKSQVLRRRTNVQVSPESLN